MAITNDSIEPSPEKDGESSDTFSRQFAAKIVHFKDLARCGEEIWIEHGGQLYRLRQTRQGKLILTK